MAADEGRIDRAALATDLERARVEFHRLLADAERDDLWTASTRATRWTNEQLLFHMVFGYMVVQRLRLLVRVLDRLPDPVSRVFARVLNGATTPFHAINYYGSCAAALVYNRRRMGPKARSSDRVTATQTRPGKRRRLPSRHALPDTLGPVLHRLHDIGRHLPLPRTAFRLPPTPAHPELRNRLNLRVIHHRPIRDT